MRSRASSTTTGNPRSWSVAAVASPAMPPPTTATRALVAMESLCRRRARADGHRPVARGRRRHSTAGGGSYLLSWPVSSASSESRRPFERAQLRAASHERRLLLRRLLDDVALEAVNHGDQLRLVRVLHSHLVERDAQ